MRGKPISCYRSTAYARISYTNAEKGVLALHSMNE